MTVSKIKSKKHGITYQVDVRYKDELGIVKRHIKSGFLKSKDAKQYEQDFFDKIELNNLKTQLMEKTFNDIYEEYMELEGKHKYAKSTLNYYHVNHQMYIKDNIGNKKLTSLKYKQVQKYFNNLSKTYNIPTIRNIRKIFAVTFRYALKHGYIKENPIPYLQLPKDNQPKVISKTITDDDLQKIVQSIQTVDKYNPYHRDMDAKFTSSAYAIAILIGRYTGLRVSEVLALEKSDFNFENKTMKVQRRIEYAGLRKSEVYLTEKLKSKNCRAILPISDQLAEILKKWFEINPYEYVICNYKGKLVHPEVLNKRIRDVSHSLGIHFRFHMLRHTYATELIMSDINPVVVKLLMRHSSVDITVDTYTHPDNDAQRQAVDQVYGDIKL